MAGEPSNSELWRLISDLRAEHGQLVRRDVYDAREAARDAAHTALAKELSDLEKAVERQEDRRAGDRRIAFTALIAPLFILAITLWLASKGVQKP